MPVFWILLSSDAQVLEAKKNGAWAIIILEKLYFILEK